MNLGMLLEMVADAAGDRLVVGSRRDGLTAQELQAAARRVATLLRSRGVEYVGLVDLNSEAVPVALFGASLAGLPFAPINYRLTDDKLNGIVARLAPGIVVAGADIGGRLQPHDGIEVITTDELLATARDESSPVDDDLPFVDPEDIAILLFTSGTTGEPKAAVLRHRHLASYIITTVEFLGADADDAQLVSVPSYHVAGVSAVLSCLYGGRRICYLPGFDPEEWVRTVEDEQISQAMVVPTMLGRVLDEMERQGASLSSLRHLSYGGGRMPVELIERAMVTLPDVNYVNAYGLTETSSTIAVLTPDDHRESAASDDPAVRRRLGSVGRPLPSVELEIRGPDGDVLPAGERGEIYVRGEQVAGEYLGRSVLTDDGWFPTNDAGFVDEHGFLYLEGRLDDVIVRGAENLSPGEIEEALLTHPAVAEAAVVGVPDPEWGEAVAAAVVLAEGEQATEAELQDWVRARLRSTKTPQLIGFYDEMPYNETGKLLRRVLRTDLAAAGEERAR
jgi:acyl-CoA synthetase (AMP-forming)/AMP-acid ligase II